MKIFEMNKIVLLVERKVTFLHRIYILKSIDKASVIVKHLTSQGENRVKTHFSNIWNIPYSYPLNG